MREIKYRGRDLDGENWNVGYYLRQGDKHMIYDLHFKAFMVVEGETVGQATPWEDMNGVRMFDGDKVRCFHFMDSYNKRRYLHHIIEWDKEKGLFKFVSCSSKEADLKNGTVMGWVYMKNSQEIEVVGNVHDAPAMSEAEVS